MKKEKDLKQLLIELDKCNKKLDEIRKPNSEYIEKLTQEIFGNKKFHDSEKVNADIEKMLADF